MKTKLVKSMPHVPLHKLIPELLEEMTLNPDERQGNVRSDQQDEPKQHKALGMRNRIKEFFGKIFKKATVTRCEINSGSEGIDYSDRQLIRHNNSENGESDSEDDFHDETPLMRRTLRI